MPIARDEVPAQLALIVFTVLLIFVGLHHEPWFDEAQAWLIARDNSPLSLVTHGVRYEGTPALWHAVLWIAQRLGLPYAGLWLVSSSFAIGGGWIVMHRSPFPIWMRMALIFSYFFAYQYSVVARSYALDLLFIPALAWLFPDRLERPLIYAAILALLANTNAHSFVLSAVLALELLWTSRMRLLALDRRFAFAIGLYGALAFLAIYQAWPPKDINFLILKRGESTAWRGVVILVEALIDRGDLWSLSPPKLPSRIMGAALTVVVLVPAISLWIAARRGVLALSLLSVLIGFSIFKYGNNWHAGIVFLTFVFCLWVSWDRLEALPKGLRKGLGVALTVLLSYQVWCGFAAEARDIAQPYSAAHATAQALKAHLESHPNERIAVAGFKGFAVQPWFDANLFANYENGAARPAYYLWRQGEVPIPGLGEGLWRETLAGGYDRLLLSSFNVMGWNGPARYIVDARQAGFCPTVLFRGSMIWKTYAMETDDMMIFDPCVSAPAVKR